MTKKYRDIKTKKGNLLYKDYLAYCFDELEKQGIVYIYNFNNRQKHPYFYYIKDLSRSQYNRFNAYIENQLNKKNNVTVYLPEQKEFFVKDLEDHEIANIYNQLKKKKVFNSQIEEEENYIWYYDDRNLDTVLMFKDTEYKSIQQEIYNIIYNNIEANYKLCIKGIMAENTYLNVFDFINKGKTDFNDFKKINTKSIYICQISILRSISVNSELLFTKNTNLKETLKYSHSLK